MKIYRLPKVFAQHSRVIAEGATEAKKRPQGLTLQVWRPTVKSQRGWKPTPSEAKGANCDREGYSTHVQADIEKALVRALPVDSWAP
jgi:hypothetical protein